MRTWGTALLISGLLVAGCGGGSLKADDPAGYKACVLLAESTKITGDPLKAMGALFEIGEHASKAETQAIRDAASPVLDADAQQAVQKAGGDAPDTQLVDSKALTAACEDNGVDIP